MKNYSYFTKTLIVITMVFFAGSLSFGQCVIQLQNGQSYTEDFESGTMECWTVEATGSATWSIMTGTLSNVVAFQNANTGDEARLISPTFDMTGVEGATFSFAYAMMALYSNDVLTVGYRTSETDSWHELGSYSINDWSNTFEAFFELPNLSSSYQISFLGQSNGGYYIFIDNIEITPTMGCARPVHLNAPVVTAFSAQLEWSTTGNEASWLVEMNGETTKVTTMPFQATGLTPQTDYTFRVKAQCDEVLESEWSMPCTFKTLCDVITVTDEEPYFDDFEASEDFVCWQNEIESGDGGWVIDPGYLVLNNTAFFIWLNEQAWLVSAPLDITEVTNPTLTFKHKQPHNEMGADELSVWYATSSNDYWHLLAEYTAVTDDWQEATFSLPEPSDSYLIAFKGKSNNENGVYVDDVRVGCNLHEGIVEQSVMAIASPNPINDKVIISANIAEGEVVVNDLFGRQVAKVALHGGRAMVDLDDVARGFYMARISDGNGITTIKLIKK